MALCLWLSPDLPLSKNKFSYDSENSQFWDVLIDVALGSVGVILPQNAWVAANARSGHSA